MKLNLNYLFLSSLASAHAVKYASQEEEASFWGRELQFSTSVPTSAVVTDPPVTLGTDSPTSSPTDASVPATDSPTPLQTGSPTSSPTDASVPVTDSPTPLQTGSPTSSPTIGATSEPSPISLPLCGITVVERRTQILSVLDTVSDPTLLATAGTPQNSAAEWLIGTDEQYVCPGDTKLIQRYVMALLYYSTDGDNWTECSEGDLGCPTNAYLSSENECTWFGNTCDAELCITEIVQEDNNVVGTIPFELEQLTGLQVLSLEQGGLASTVPSNLGTLSSLRILDLDFNRITGPIPEEIYSLTALEQLDLNTNLFSGALSPSVGNLVNLQLLQVYENLMTGAIPTELGLVSGLVIAEFYNNTFTGVMPVEVCNNVSPGGSITALTSDCFPNPVPQIVCACCTGCALD